jgi:hypothetical protein
MFTREELRTRHQEYRERPLIIVERTLIDCWSMEAEGVIHRHYQWLYEGALHWWVNSQRVIEQTMPPADHGWRLVKPEEALCQPVDEARFVEMISECLSADFFTAALKPLGEFRGAMLMRDEWWYRVAVAEFADRYYAAYWSTSG